MASNTKNRTKDQNSAQAKMCPNYSKLMINMQPKLQKLVMKSEGKRLKTIVKAVLNVVAALLAILHIDLPDDNDDVWYKIQSKIYTDFEDKVDTVITHKCNKGVNFTRVKKSKGKEGIWGLFKGYWFHNAPKVMVKSLWIPIFNDIALYFDKISNKYATYNRNMDMRTFLKLKFLKNIYEVHCQINVQSNPSGPVVQHAAWKEVLLQSIVHDRFDSTYRWNVWLETKQNGKHIRITKIIQTLVKPYAQKRYCEFCKINNIQYNNDEFKVNMNEITELNIMNLIRSDNVINVYENDQKSTSDQSDASDHGRAMVNISVEPPILPFNNYNTYDNNNDYYDQRVQPPPIFPPNYSYLPIHGVPYHHSQYRWHPYTHFSDIYRQKHTKCNECGHCLHHCLCKNNNANNNNNNNNDNNGSNMVNINLQNNNAILPIPSQISNETATTINNNDLFINDGNTIDNSPEYDPVTAHMLTQDLDIELEINMDPTSYLGGNIDIIFDDNVHDDEYSSPINPSISNIDCPSQLSVNDDVNTTNDM